MVRLGREKVSGYLRIPKPEKGSLKTHFPVFRLPFAFSQPRHADYALNLAQRRQYARQVVYLFDFQREAHAGFQVAALGLHGGYIGFVARERFGNVAQQAAAVLGADFAPRRRA